MKIPVRNIYYLLCYAWDHLEERNKIHVGSSDFDNIINLLSSVLIRGCNSLWRRGLNRDYVEFTSSYNGVKGKIDFSSSIKYQLFPMGKTMCCYDEFHYDILSNQILKATLQSIYSCTQLEKGLRGDVRAAYLQLKEVSTISLSDNTFKKLTFRANDQFYSFILKVCRLIYNLIAPDEGGHGYAFKDFERDDKRMAKLFEAFVRNFYKKELTQFKTSSPKIQWSAKADGSSDLQLLPEMRTDLCLSSPDRKIILDTKYYSELFSKHFDKKSFRSSNLYQIHSYLTNLAADTTSNLNSTAEGILLYPTVQENVDQTFYITGHRIKIATVNLADPWKEINARLKSVILN